ncbi:MULTISPECIES: hypothetical protein [unclassified Mesorhizobium]|uniref:hypothetical protein n=1 Tax=unclassified Mesorhizobium TaxID=325217 RepID=UPI001FE163A6|nr:MULTISPECIES: hypothetical protein [unclassified Mesorhizobium]
MIGSDMRRFDRLRLTVIDRQFLFQDQVLRLIVIHVDVGLIKLGLIGLAVEIFVGDRPVGNGVSLDRLNVSGFGLLDLTVVERKLVLERHLDRVVEIGIERRLGRRRSDCSLDNLRRGGALVRVGRIIVDPEVLIQRGRHFPVDGKVILQRRDFQGTHDRPVEIIVPAEIIVPVVGGRVGDRLRRTGRGKMSMIRCVVKNKVPLEGRGNLIVGESKVGRLVLHGRRVFPDGVEFAHHLLFEVDIEIGLLRSLVCGWSLCGRWRLRPDRLTRVETHDPGQFRERIVVGDVVACGCFQLGSVCHYCSRTRTQSDAMDVAQGWPLPAQCGQKVTGFLVKPNAFR